MKQRSTLCSETLVNPIAFCNKLKLLCKCNGLNIPSRFKGLNLQEEEVISAYTRLALFAVACHRHIDIASYNANNIPACVV